MVDKIKFSGGAAVGGVAAYYYCRMAVRCAC
jgi:hypothetical protein